MVRNQRLSQAAFNAPLMAGDKIETRCDNKPKQCVCDNSQMIEVLQSSAIVAGHEGWFLGNRKRDSFEKIEVKKQ